MKLRCLPQELYELYSVLTYDAEDDFISRNAYAVVLFRLFDSWAYIRQYLLHVQVTHTKFKFNNCTYLEKNTRNHRLPASG